MAILEGFGDPVEEINEEDFQEKVKKLSPFDFINSINFKNDLIAEDPRNESQYNPFMINRGLGQHAQTVLQANEMNRNYHLDHKLQYDYLMGAVPKGKRGGKWAKNDDENIEIIQKFFGYSFIKAKEALNLLNDTHIELIKLYLNTSKGGKA